MGQLCDPSCSHGVFLEAQPKNIAKDAANDALFKKQFKVYHIMEIQKKAKVEVVEEERIRYKDNRKWNFTKIALEKQFQTDFHYHQIDPGHEKGEGHTLLVEVKEVKADVYYKKKQLESKPTQHLLEIMGQRWTAIIEQSRKGRDTIL